MNSAEGALFFVAQNHRSTVNDHGAVTFSNFCPKLEPNIV